MPGSVIAELLLQPLLEAVLQIFGYWTGRIAVPVLSFGLIRIEDAPRTRRTRPRLRGARRLDRHFVIGDDACMFLGLLFWAVAGIGAYFVFR